MNKQQISKILITGMIATALMLLFELIFDIPCVSDAISDFVSMQSPVLVYVVIWILMMLQVTIVPIPAIIVLTSAMGAGILDTSNGLAAFELGSTWMFIFIVMSAYMVGAVLSYWVGRTWGKKAVLWCAGSEQDYEKWSKFLNRKGSKWLYAGTVLLPVFPDDLIVLVCGSVKFDFTFFFWSNLICRTIGLITSIASLIIIGAGGGSPLAAIAWAVALLAEIVAYIIVRTLIKREQTT